MQAYNWPQNHKELENFVVQVLTRVHQRTIRTEALPASDAESSPRAP